MGSSHIRPTFFWNSYYSIFVVDCTCTYKILVYNPQHVPDLLNQIIYNKIFWQLWRIVHSKCHFCIVPLHLYWGRFKLHQYITKIDRKWWVDLRLRYFIVNNYNMHVNTSIISLIMDHLGYCGSTFSWDFVTCNTGGLINTT